MLSGGQIVDLRSNSQDLLAKERYKSYRMCFCGALYLFWFSSYELICRKMLKMTKFDLW